MVYQCLHVSIYKFPMPGHIMIRLQFLQILLSCSSCNASCQVWTHSLYSCLTTIQGNIVRREEREILLDRN